MVMSILEVSCSTKQMDKELTLIQQIERSIQVPGKMINSTEKEKRLCLKSHILMVHLVKERRQVMVFTNGKMDLCSMVTF